MEKLLKTAANLLLQKATSGSTAYQYQNENNSGKSIANLFKGE